MSADLNARQRAFVTAFLQDPQHRQKEAAIKAGFSVKTASMAGSRIYADKRVRAEIDRRLKEIENKADVTVSDVIKELKLLAFVDIRKAFGPDGKLLPIEKLPDDVAHAIMSIDDGGVMGEQKIRFNSKTASLELLGRYLKMFIDRIEHTVDESIFERLERARLYAKKAYK